MYALSLYRALSTLWDVAIASLHGCISVCIQMAIYTCMHEVD